MKRMLFVRRQVVSVCDVAVITKRTNVCKKALDIVQITEYNMK